MTRIVWGVCAVLWLLFALPEGLYRLERQLFWSHVMAAVRALLKTGALLLVGMALLWLTPPDPRSYVISVEQQVGYYVLAVAGAAAVGLVSFLKRNRAVEPDPSSAPRIREGSSPSLLTARGHEKAALFGRAAFPEKIVWYADWDSNPGPIG